MVIAKDLSTEEREEILFDMFRNKVYPSISISKLRSIDAENKKRLAAKLCSIYKLAFNYSLFGITCYFDKQNWTNKLDLAVSPFNYGQPQMLSIKERKKLKFIFGSGNSFIESILRCILNAYSAGVI